MAASGEHIKALVRSHAAGDDDGFYAVALQLAAQAARQGHNRLAADLKKAIDSSRRHSTNTSVTSISRPKGELAELVTASHPTTRLRDLIVPERLLAQIAQLLTEQRQRKTILQHGFVPSHRLLLEGPPGTGKTLTASVIAHELSLPLLTVRLDSLMSKYMGETASKLRTVFDAVGDQRAVYLFDEFDALGAHRTGNDVGEARRILNSFLVFLENASAESVVIAATNHRAILDRALFRRFDMVMIYDLPREVDAVALMRSRLGKMGVGIKWKTTSHLCEGLSHADLVKASEAAAKRALISGASKVTTEGLSIALEERRAASLD